MNPQTTFFEQNWQISADGVTNGHQENWHAMDAGKTYRLLHLSCQATTSEAMRIRLFLTSHGGQYYVLKEDDVKAGYMLSWNGSMILRGCTSIGGQVFGPSTAGDAFYMRAIWEEIQ